MVHEMKLQDVYFNKIASKEKIYEVRLNDEKRKLINIDDTIVFTNLTTKQTIKVRVTNLYHFKSFVQMASTLPATLLGFENYSKEQIVGTYHTFYTPYNEQTYGVLAIQVKCI